MNKKLLKRAQKTWANERKEAKAMLNPVVEYCPPCYCATAARPAYTIVDTPTTEVRCGGGAGGYFNHNTETK